MDTISLSITAIVLYLLSAGLQILYLTGRQANKHLPVLIFGTCAMIIHGLQVYYTLYSTEGIQLSFFKAASLISWLIAAIVTLSSWRLSLENMFVVIFPVAAIMIILSITMSDDTVPAVKMRMGIISHILSSLMAYSVLIIATLQSLLVAWQDHRLKSKNSKLLIHTFPPLETMERFLFTLLVIGLVLLSLGIITGFIFIENIFSQHLLHKTVLSIVAWVIFFILSWGHYKRGWRGMTVIRWLIAAAICLILAYFGSKFVIEIILHKK